MVGFPSEAENSSYDVIIAGGAMYGSSVAWWLTQFGFGGRILIVERDVTYENASTSHTNSCIRQQFSSETNIRISQFGADFIKNFQSYMHDEPEAPEIVLQSYGYMYLAATQKFAETLREGQEIQERLGAATKHLSREEIARAYPFYNLDDIVGANHNLVDEGYFDGGSIFDWWRKSARARGVEFIQAEVAGIEMTVDGKGVSGVVLGSGSRISCGRFVNATGPRAALTAAMVGVDLPVEPRKRYTFIFEAETPLEQDLPLTIDPSGVHMRTDGRYYLAGCPPDSDPAVDPDDFIEDHSLWENKVWPALFHRVPKFEAIRLINSWVGHYAYNTFDQNAVVGPHPTISNFVFVNGFSGHGLQQSPAIGRGVAEWIIHGEYRELDLKPLAFDRILNNEAYVEKAVI